MRSESLIPKLWVMGIKGARTDSEIIWQLEKTTSREKTELYHKHHKLSILTQITNILINLTIYYIKRYIIKFKYMQPLRILRLR